jgi:hypothetical protein
MLLERRTFANYFNNWKQTKICFDGIEIQYLVNKFHRNSFEFFKSINKKNLDDFF